MSTSTTYRAMHDIGLAAWFGGSLFGVFGLNAAAEEARDQRTTARVSSVGWAKWAPVNLAAVAVHAIGGAGLLAENRKRAAVQKGATATATTKLALTGAALAATAYTRLLGKKIEDATIHQASDVPSTVTSHASPSSTRTGEGSAAQQADKIAGQALSEAAHQLPVDVRQAQRQLAWVQFLVPALTGAALVLGAQAGEEQRPLEQLKGVARRAGAVVGVDV